MTSSRKCTIEGLDAMLVSYKKNNETRYRIEVGGRVVDDCSGVGYTSEVAAEQGFRRQVSGARQFLVSNPEIIKRLFETKVNDATSHDDRIGLLSAMLDGVGLRKDEKEDFINWYTDHGGKQ